MYKLILLLTPLLLLADHGTLSKIVDGDTLYFKTNGKTVKCRIDYIDTPESKLNTKLKKDISKCHVKAKEMKSAGLSATRQAKRLLQLHKTYEYDVKGKDHYGRSICIVHNGDTTFNEQMVVSGYATIFRYYMNKSELNHFEPLLQQAKNNRIGLWSNRYEVMECLDNARK